MTQPICEDRSLLFAKEAFVNTRSCSVLTSNSTNFRPLFAFSICQLNCLLRLFMLSLTGLITWAAKDKLNAASSQHTDAMYAPLARCATYWSFSVSAVQVVPLELVVVASLVVLTVYRFLHWRSQLKVMLSSVKCIILLLNLIGLLMLSCLRSLAINLALCSSFCSAFANVSSARNKVSLVYRPTMLKGLLLYRRQGLYIDQSMCSCCTQQEQQVLNQWLLASSTL